MSTFANIFGENESDTTNDYQKTKEKKKVI